jgi:hypothetical protein
MNSSENSPTITKFAEPVTEERLRRYATLRRENDHQIARLELIGERIQIEDTMREAFEQMTRYDELYLKALKLGRPDVAEEAYKQGRKASMVWRELYLMSRPEPEAKAPAKEKAPSRGYRRGKKSREVFY